MKENKEWFQTTELIGVDGLPKTTQGINLKAKTEGWKKRKAEGVKGRAYEYHIDSMPSDIKIKLIAKWRNTVEWSKPRKETVKIPYYDIYASAGQGALVNYEEAPSIVEISPAYLLNQGVPTKNLCAVRVKGDSMEPTLFDGDVVILKREQEVSRVLEGVYVIRIDSQLFIKRIQYNKFEGYMQVDSDNAYYRSFTIKGEDLNAVQIIGEAVLTLGRIRKLAPQRDNDSIVVPKEL